MTEIENFKKNCKQCCNFSNCDMKNERMMICVWFFDKTKHKKEETEEIFEKIDKQFRINLNKFFEAQL